MEFFARRGNAELILRLPLLGARTPINTKRRGRARTLKDEGARRPGGRTGSPLGHQSGPGAAAHRRTGAPRPWCGPAATRARPPAPRGIGRLVERDDRETTCETTCETIDDRRIERTERGTQVTGRATASVSFGSRLCISAPEEILHFPASSLS